MRSRKLHWARGLQAVAMDQRPLQAAMDPNRLPADTEPRLQWVDTVLLPQPAGTALLFQKPGDMELLQVDTANSARATQAYLFRHCE